MVAGGPQGPFRKAVRVSWAKKKKLLILSWIGLVIRSGPSPTPNPDFTITVTAPTMGLLDNNARQQDNTPHTWNHVVANNTALDFSDPPTNAISCAYREIVSTTSHSETETFHFVDRGKYFAAVDGGVVVITSLVDPLFGVIIPFVIDERPGAPSDPDELNVLRNQTQINDYMNNLNSYYPGFHHYSPTLSEELEGHDASTTIETKTTTFADTVFVDLTKLMSTRHLDKDHDSPLSIVLKPHVDTNLPGGQTQGWLMELVAEVVPRINAQTWPVDHDGFPYWNPPNPGSPNNRPPFSVASYDDKVSDNRTEGAKPEKNFTVHVTLKDDWATTITISDPT